MTEIPEADSLRQANLRYLLNQWDPIGVADLVDDEYDCLLAPLWKILTHGVTRAALSEYLWFELQDHFGLDPEYCGTDAFADRLLAFAANWGSCPGCRPRSGKRVGDPELGVAIGAADLTEQVEELDSDGGSRHGDRTGPGRVRHSGPAV